MTQYLLEKILSYAKALHIFDRSSIVILLITAPISSILIFNLQSGWKKLIIHLMPIKLPIFGYVLGREYDFIPAFGADSLGLIAWLLIFIVSRKFLDVLINKYIDWLSKRQTKYSVDFTKINSKKFERDWITQGSPILRHDGLAFTNSNSGCLIKEGSHWIKSKNLRKWKNFKAEVVVNFVPEYHVTNDRLSANNYMCWKRKDEEFRKVIGIVFGAQNLENYFMLEVWKVENVLSVRPHVRMHGNWDAPLYNAPCKLNLYKSEIVFVLIVRNNIAYLKVDNNVILEWVLPKEFEANLLQHPQPSTSLKDSVVSKVPFTNKVGMLGFRNYGNALAIVKRLKIESLK